MMTMDEIEPASDELIAEIERGMDHVFPGPWFLEGNWNENDKHIFGWLSYFPPAGSPVFELVPVVGAAKEIVANAKHLARMSPDNVAAILARLRKAEADNANMAKMLAGYHQICSEHGIAPSSSEIYAAADRAGGKADE
jgi:hypothetical protein